MPSYGSQTPILEARGITKRFPGVIANQDVSLSISPGQIVGLLGENGAGKSTLVKMIYGLYEPDEGEIYIKGSPVKLSGPRDAIRRGIGMVHQHRLHRMVEIGVETDTDPPDRLRPFPGQFGPGGGVGRVGNPGVGGVFRTVRSPG